MFTFGKGGPNYPAGPNPYNGQPLRVNPNYRYFTPGAAFAPSAEEMNYIFAGFTDAAAAGAISAGASWSVATPLVGSMTNFTGGQFDPIKKQWLLAFTTAGGDDVVTSAGFGDADYGSSSSVSGASSTGFRITDCLFDGTHYFAACAAGGNLNIARCSPGGAWSVVFTDSTQLWADAQIRIVGASIVVYAISTTVMSAFYSAVGGGAGGSWTSVLMASQAGANIFSASNGNLTVVFPDVTAPLTYVTSSAVGVYSGHLSSGFLTHGTETPKGLAYSPADGVFVLNTVSGVDLKVYTYNSVDGVTWSQVGAFSSSSGWARGLGATAAGCLVALWGDPATSGDRVIYSTDAGATWHPTSVLLANPGSTITQPKVIASSTGFWAMNNAGSRFSENSGLSPALT